MVGELGNNIVPVLAIACTFVFFVVWVIAATIESIHKTKCQSQLKQFLIERGASASEIEKVVNAGATDWTGAPLSDGTSENRTPVPPVKSSAYPMSG